MVKAFQFAALPIIHFQNGMLGSLPKIIKNYGNSVILATGKESLNQTGKFIELLNAFEMSGIVYHRVSIPGEPGPSIIDETVARYRNTKIDVVVGIGGGSVLDAGKAISAMMYKEESVMTFLEGVGDRNHPGTKLPYIAIPTTSGTGSEATKNAVLSETGINGFKKSLRHDRFVPDVALVDPELTLPCPRDITAAAGMDCFTQLLEAYLSVKGSAYTDALALEGLKEVEASLLQSFLNGDDISARTGMSFAALTSGICLANAGLGLVHGFASSIGGMYPIPHGIVCGTLMATANEINVRELRKTQTNPAALKKYALLGKLFLKQKGKTEAYYIDWFINHLHKLTQQLQLPCLKQYGLNEEDLVNICKITDGKNNPVKLGKEEMVEVLRGRFGQ